MIGLCSPQIKCSSIHLN